MADNFGSFDPFDGRPPPLSARREAERMSEMELARRLSHILAEAAKKVGVRYDDYGYDFESLAGEIVVAAQGGGRLEPAAYRAVWYIWTIFRKHRGPDG